MTTRYDGDEMDPHAAFREDGEDSASLRGRLESLLPNVLRKTVSTGVGARQMTEEVVRNAIGDMKLPKEAVTYLIDVADNTKKEVVRVAAREFREFLESARFNDELARMLTQLSFEIRTEIRFVPNDDRLRPSVSSRAHLNTGARGAEDEEIAAADGINDAIRTGAQDIAEMMLSRVFGGKDSEEADAAPAPDEADGAAPAAAAASAEPEPEPATPKKKRATSASRKGTATRKKSASRSTQARSTTTRAKSTSKSSARRTRKKKEPDAEA